MKTFISFSALLLLFVFTGEKSNAQVDDQSTLSQLVIQDSADVNTLAAYPENVRQNMYEVAAHPEAVTKMNDIQKQSNERFKNLLSSYSQAEQEKIWNITRYDGLISKLTTGGKKSPAETETILKDYPKDVHDDALNYSEKQYDLLVNIDRMNKQFSESFEGLINTYPQKTQTAFRELIKTPEVITILNNNMNMTVRLGDVYKNNPALVSQKFDELNLQLAQQKTKDLEEWKQTMQNDPDAKKELKESADQYAQENGYQKNEYANTEPVVVEHYVYVPYPYWCGYPWWHADPYWYPYPYWYHTGFYYWHDDFVWIGQPSWFFIHWHFHHHPYIYNYPHLTNAYLHYYHGPRRSFVYNSREVNTWVRDNRKNLPKGFLKNDPQRPDRIREYGKFQMDYDQRINSNPRQPVNREEFLQQHATDYPHMQGPRNGQTNPRGGTGTPAPVPSGPGRNNPTTQPNNPPPVRGVEAGPRQQEHSQPPVKIRDQRPGDHQQIQSPPKQRIQEPRPPREIRQNTPRQQPKQGMESRPKRMAENDAKKDPRDK